MAGPGGADLRLSSAGTMWAEKESRTVHEYEYLQVGNGHFGEVSMKFAFNLIVCHEESKK